MGSLAGSFTAPCLRSPSISREAARAGCLLATPALPELRCPRAVHRAGRQGSAEPHHRTSSNQESPSSHSHRTSPPHHKDVHPFPEGKRVLDLPQHSKQGKLQAFPSKISLSRKRCPRTNTLLAWRAGRQADHKQAQTQKRFVPKAGAFHM